MPVQCTCARCGAPFFVVPAQIERGRGKHCSKSCADATRRQHVECICERCGATFALKPSKANRGERTFCSVTCRGAASKTPPSEATCQQCGVVFVLATWRILKGEGQFCSRACRDRGAHIPRVLAGAQAGPNNHKWRGGYEPYYGPSWRPAQLAARRRDAVCQGCGITPSQNGSALDVHHLIPFRTFGRDRHAEANELANLVTLCRTCHLRLEWATNWRQS